MAIGEMKTGTIKSVLSRPAARIERSNSKASAMPRLI
jgi:hypothetical protein